MPAEIPMQNGMVGPAKPGLPGSTPVGMAGTVPTMKKAPSTGGRPSGTNSTAPPKAAPPDPYDTLAKDTVKKLRLYFLQGIQAGDLSPEDPAQKFRDFLASKGWDSANDDERIIELMAKFKVKDQDEFYSKIISGELENAQTGQESQAVPGVNQQPQKPIMKGSSLMGKRIKIEGGVLVEASTDVTSVLDNLSRAIRTVEACTQKVAEAKMLRFAADALSGGLGGPLDGAPEDGGLKDIAAPKGDGVQSAVKDLKKAVEKLSDALGEADSFKSDNADSLGFDDADKLDKGMDKGTAALGKADKAIDADLPVVSKGLDSKPIAAAAADAVKQAEFPFAKKDNDKDESKSDEKKEDHEKKETSSDEKKEDKDNEKKAEAGSAKESHSGKSQDAEDAFMGKKGPEGDKKVSASEILAQIQTHIAALTDADGMIREAQLYPFKDLNKTNVDDINKQTAKDQATEINSEIKGQPAKDKLNPRIAPKDIADGGLNAKYDGASKKVDIKTAERVKQHAVENSVSKARLAVELAAKQQLKGLLDNPLRTAFVKNMVDAGITKEAAEVIAHNSFIDGYEPAQGVVIKEAFTTFMNQSLDEFIKADNFTKTFVSKEASFVESPEAGATTKTASVSGADSALDIPQDAYRKYWTQISSERSRF